MAEPGRLRTARTSRRAWQACIIAAFGALLHSTSAALEVPETRGDQLLFFYDTRAQRVSYINVSNPGDEAQVVEIAFYPQDLGAPNAVFHTLLGGSNEIFNPGLQGAAGQAGLVVITPVVSEGDPRPVVPERRLAGSFTLANQELSAAFGENAFGRGAVNEDEERPPGGEVVDGETIRYEQIRPQVLMVPTYFNPEELSPPEQDGNRFILAAFRDVYGTPFRIASPGNPVGLETTLCSRGSGEIAKGDLEVSGVTLTNLQELAGEDEELTSSGSVYLGVPSATEDDTNLFGVFAQSLETYASGHRLSAAASVPMCQAVPTSMPSPSLTPIPTASPVPACDGQRVDTGEECDGMNKPSCQGYLSFVACTGEVQCQDCKIDASACDCPCTKDLDCLSAADCVEGRCVRVR